MSIFGLWRYFSLSHVQTSNLKFVFDYNSASKIIFKA